MSRLWPVERTPPRPFGRPFRLVAGAALAVLLGTPLPVVHAVPRDARGDVTVVAVIDDGMTPYHWDFLASKMPQAATRDRSDDLPLGSPPHTWLPGFPSPKAFDRYEPLRLTLEQRDGKAAPAELARTDAEVWDSVEPSTASELNYYWMPGTKVVGAITFEPAPPTAQEPSDAAYWTAGPGRIYADTTQHGTGSTSVSVGNLHGTCPECVLVFLQMAGLSSAHRAIEWAMRQPWIDAISNSYAGNGTVVLRDGVYGRGNTRLQREASERGQTIFWSAGNGLENSFVLPKSTVLSAQTGPDWIVTVGATAAGQRSNYSGSGKPVDLAAPGARYPAAYESPSVSGTGEFAGTSNAAPVVAGIYSQVLYRARRLMPGASRAQSRGVVARGKARCGSARRDCELGDGALTATELRFRLLQSAFPYTTGLTAASSGLARPLAPWVADTRFAGEGHGTYFGRVSKTLRPDELDRVWRPLVGSAKAPVRPAGERDWMVVDSWCRQRLWGEWRGGYYAKGATLPVEDPQRFPARTAYQNACAVAVPPPAP